MTSKEARCLPHLRGGSALRLRTNDNRDDTVQYVGHILGLGPYFLSEAEIQNFLRLQLITIDYSHETTDTETYNKLETEFEERRETLFEDFSPEDRDHVEIVADRCLFNVTVFGVNFRDACVPDDEWRF